MLDSVEIDWRLFKKINQDYKINLYKEIKEIITSADKIQELGINNQAMSKLKKDILQKINLFA